jgi:hypothetical protein
MAQLHQMLEYLRIAISFAMEIVSTTAKHLVSKSTPAEPQNAQCGRAFEYRPPRPAGAVVNDQPADIVMQNLIERR